MTTEYNYAQAIPGIEAIRQTVEANITWGRWEQQVIMPVVIDGAARDAGNTDDTTILRPGLLMGRVTASNKFQQWNNQPAVANFGVEYPTGILLYDQKMQYLGANKDRWVGYLLVAGNVKASAVQDPVESSAGIAGIGNEYLIRGSFGGRLLFDDDFGAPHSGGVGGLGGHQHGFLGFRNIVDVSDLHATAYTATLGQSGTLFHNYGITDNFTLTLPIPVPGVTYGFLSCGGVSAEENTILVNTAAGDELIAFNDKAADSVAFSTAGDIIGGCYLFIGITDGTTPKYFVMPIAWGADGVLVQTATIAT